MSSPTILVVCGDPGGAVAVAPVVNRLLALGREKVEVFCYGEGPHVLRKADVTTLMHVAESDASGPEGLVERSAAVFTSTSGPNRANHELRAVRRAVELGIPSATFVDFWSNYAARFRLSPTLEMVLADRILAVDNRMRSGLIEAGVPASRVRVVGHPAFDALSGGQPDAEARARVRSAHGVGVNEKFVVFAAQPVGASAAPPRLVTADSNALRQHRTLETLLGALERIALRRELNITLAVRPHPREPSPDIALQPTSRVRVVVRADGSTHEVAGACDAVVAVTTMLLVEATLMHRPALAVRLDWPSELRETLPPFVAQARDVSALDAWLEATLTTEAAPDTSAVDHELIDGGATERVVNEIHALLEHGSARAGAR